MNDNYEGIAFFGGGFFGVILGGLIGAMLYAHNIPSNIKQEIVCESYLHGQWHEDVCIKDGKVVVTKK